MDQASRAAGPPSPTPTPSGLGRFSALTRGWFEGAFAAPTQAQVGAWDALAQDQDVLVVAPPGSGKTPADARRRFPTHPPDILITTPESLFLLLTSRAREALAYVDTVIVDEVHSVVATKRGAHLALSLERLDELLERPARRIGLSATVRPLDEVARFLGGPRPVTVVAPPSEKAFDLSVVVPVEDMAAIGEASDDPASGSASGLPDRSSIWPHIDERLVELIRAHRSTIVFANSRRLAERLCANLNELAGEELARAQLGRVRPPAHRPGRPPGGRGQPGHRLPQVPRRPGRERGRGRAHAGRGDRGHALPPQPPGRARPADRGHGRHGRLDRRRPRGPGPPGGPVRRAPPQRPRQRARHAVGPLPLGRVRRAAAPAQLGPGRGAAGRPAGGPT